MNQEKLLENLKNININLSKKQLNQLEIYYEKIIEYNKIHNLTRITEKEEVYLKHFYDSLTLATLENLSGPKSLCDMGSGAGFPGIVLKIAFPDLKITLVDSLKKRTIFLEKVINDLKLEKISVYNERAEDFAKKNIETFDFITARAVASTPILLELGVPMLKINGHMLIMKAKNENLNEATNALKTLNSEIEKVKEINLPITNEKRMLIKVKKVSKTNSKYPRNYSQIKKKPL
ncbi:16S rRNA (guanine(527)-N(7))-methyltransferase RsmG [Lutibacter sp.]|uniref:16S rRNA (guanine(527)-N(7))-methyltransferase RsmG n=1 Tax=Lutibacter sp. TaxID=1925666 RepID=UPI0034A07D1C